jgi:hypothetical protein
VIFFKQRRNIMNTLRGSQSIVFFALIFLFSNTVLAAKIRCNELGEKYSVYMPGYYYGDFNVIDSSCKTLKKKHWNSFGIEKKYWTGRGVHTYCKVNTPINRTLRALELLRISTNPELKKNNLLNAAYARSKRWINHLRFECIPNKSIVGLHEPKPRWRDEKEPGSGKVYLTQNIFAYPIIQIANTIIHEARHKKKFHHGGDGCPRKASCDTSYEYKGANTYELIYSWKYGLSSTHSNYFTRQMALDHARYIHDNGFNVYPGRNIPKYAD